MSSNTITIKSCPWCGASGSMVVDSLGYGNGRGYTGCHRYYVQCTNSGCRAVAPNGKYDDIYEKSDVAKQKAIDTWNTRKEE